MENQTDDLWGFLFPQGCEIPPGMRAPGAWGDCLPLWTPYLQGLARVWHIVGKHDICSFDEWVNFLFLKYTSSFCHKDSHLALQWEQILFRNQTESLYLIELTFKSQESENMHHLYLYHLHYCKRTRVEGEMTICLITSHSQLFRGSFCYWRIAQVESLCC